MSNNNSSIEGSGYFYDTSENAGTVTVAEFYDSATNTGSITDNAVFNDSAANHGDVAVAVFDGTSENTGTVDNAVFLGSAVNAGIVSVSATFQGSSQNMGSAAAATFQDNASNSGGTVTGNAVFEGTSTNSGGTVGGDASFAATATNNGTVVGEVTNTNPASGTVLTSGVTNYITINGNQYQNGTYDVVADGNGGSNNVYNYLMVGLNIASAIAYTEYSVGGNAGFDFANGTIDYVSDGTGGYTESNRVYPAPGIILGTYNSQNYVSNGNGTWSLHAVAGTVLTYNNNNYININGNIYQNGNYNVVTDGSGGTYNVYTYAANGTLIGTDNTYNYISDGNGSYNSIYVSGYVIAYNNTNYIAINGTNYNNGTFDIIANGSDGTYNGNYQYIAYNNPIANDVPVYETVAGIQVLNGTVDYISDGNGSYYLSDRTYPGSGETLYSTPISVEIEGTTFTIGNRNLEADGAGGGELYNYYTPYGELITNIGGTDYYSDGAGGYTTNP